MLLFVWGKALALHRHATWSPRIAHSLAA